MDAGYWAGMAGYVRYPGIVDCGTGALFHFLLLVMRASSPKGMQKFHLACCLVFWGQLSMEPRRRLPESAAPRAGYPRQYDA